MSRQAFKREAEVGPHGKVAIDVPLPAGSRVEVVVLTGEIDEFADLVQAAESSLKFWDNPIDDAEWNDA
jgi:hypothetical protein